MRDGRDLDPDEPQLLYAAGHFFGVVLRAEVWIDGRHSVKPARMRRAQRRYAVVCRTRILYVRAADKGLDDRARDAVLFACEKLRLIARFVKNDVLAQMNVRIDDLFHDSVSPPPRVQFRYASGFIPVNFSKEMEK